MIKFIEHHEPGYALRTVANARAADLTIAFAVDFKTPGEILTHKVAYGKYIAFNIGWYREPSDIYQQCLDVQRTIIEKNVKVLNVAGNGLYTLYAYEKRQQQDVDDLIYKLLHDILIDVFTADMTIRSGGQTGVDEAALKAGDKLGLDCTCLAPKNWLFRDINGKDHMHDPDAFCARFGEQYVNNI